MYSTWRVFYHYGLAGYRRPTHYNDTEERIFILELGRDLDKIRSLLESRGYSLDRAEYLGDGELIPFAKEKEK
jgi:hypothetical protein